MLWKYYVAHICTAHCAAGQRLPRGCFCVFFLEIALFAGIAHLYGRFYEVTDAIKRGSALWIPIKKSSTPEASQEASAEITLLASKSSERACGPFLSEQAVLYS